MNKIIERLRSVANRCVRVNTDVALLCEAALSAADAMERQQQRHAEPVPTMNEPIAWMVTNDDGQDAYVTANPALAQAGQRALPLYTTAFGSGLPTGSSTWAGGIVSMPTYPSREIQSGDGVANAAIAEAAKQLATLHVENKRLREQVARTNDAARLLGNVLEKGHRYVLCVEPQDGNGKAQMDNLPTRTDLARMLERFARTARADLKEMRGDE